ncbi:MAG: energy transducer TonB [Gammaproteobacteria bacterium]|nr:energy transducer TonB [Gammaproteobacteria bacterium]
MNIRPVLAICASVLCLTAAADMQREFNDAYKAYRDAVSAEQYHQAVAPAGEARRLGELLYAEDPRSIAKLVFNEGFVLGKLSRRDEAYPILQQARKLTREAFGEAAEEMLDVEVALLGVAPLSRARYHMQQALKLADVHRAGDDAFIAGIKLQGGLRLRGKDTMSLLEEAAESYQAAGREEGFALAQFWIGKRHMQNKRHRRAPKPLEAAIDALPERHHLALMARAHLVEVYERLGQSDEATEHCLAIGRATPWTGNDDYQPLFKRGPVYPQTALNNNREGYVLLEFTVDEMGFVRNPEVVESGGNAIFREPAVEAAKGFRYAPRFVDGKAVPVPNVRNRIVFKIRVTAN